MFGWCEGRDTTLGLPQGTGAGSILSLLYLCRLSSPPPGGGPWARPDPGSAVRRQICLIFSFEGNWLKKRWKGSAPRDGEKQKQASIISVFPEKNKKIKSMQVREKEWDSERDGRMGREGERKRGREAEKRKEGGRALQKPPRSSSLTHVHWPVLLWCTHTIQKYR